MSKITSRPLHRAVRGAVIIALASLTIVGAPGPASAGPPPDGRWTKVNEDMFEHWACKERVDGGAYGPLWLVRTRTWVNGQDEYEAGIWAAIVRQPGSRIIHQISKDNWFYGWIGTDSMYASMFHDDRIYIQGAYYGPPDWRNAVRVRNIRTCA